MEGKIMETVLESELHSKISDQDKVREVLAALPPRLKSFLTRQREALMGIKKKKRNNHVRHVYYVE